MRKEPKEGDLVKVEVTRRQFALLALVSTMNNGKLEEVIVKNGEPIVVKGGVQRIDLERPEELTTTIEKMGGYFPVDFRPASVRAGAANVGKEIQAEQSKASEDPGN